MLVRRHRSPRTQPAIAVVASALLALPACGRRSVAMHAIGGAVEGLAGSGLVLRAADGEPLAVRGDGPFTFTGRLAAGARYAVTVESQPVSPWQTCEVSSGAGTVGDAAVADVRVRCTTNRYAVGGPVIGLAGRGLRLRDAAGGPIELAPGEGAFTLPAPVESGTPIAVTVEAQPVSPWQTCEVTPGAGRVADAAVTDVRVTCTTNRYGVGGTVTGLAGRGLRLRDAAGGQAELAPGAGTFTLPAPVESGTPIAVTVEAQPESPWQTCAVTPAAGTVAGAAVTDVRVSCTTNRYAVGGTVSGLLGGGLVLADAAAGSVLVPAGATAFQLPTALPSGARYAVTVPSQPTAPWQTCQVTAGQAGALTSGDVGAVAVRCTSDTHSVAGTCTIAGRPEAGIAVTLSGAASASVLTDAGGTYAFADLAQGRYTLTAASGGVTFSPAALAVVVGGADLVRQDFTGVFSTLAWDQGRWDRGHWE